GTWHTNSRSGLGAIASNGNIDLYDGVQVRGDARCGVGRKTNVYDNAKVFGVRAPLVAPLRFPSVTIPVGLTDLGDITLGGSQTSTLPGGNYLIRSFTMSG